MKQFVLVLLMIAAGTGVAYMHVASQSYHPVLRVSAPEGMTYTALLDPTSERRECGAMNDRFLDAVKAQCKDCKIEFARCERQTEAVDLALEKAEGASHHWVVSRGLRIAVVGPAEAAQASCDQIADDLVKRGIASSSCARPVARPAKS